MGRDFATTLPYSRHMSDAPDSPAPQTHEYRVVPAPRRGERARGVRTGEGRFALALSRVVNHMAQSGWEFVRTDTLPCEERVGLTQTTIRHHAMLVFRRALPGAAPATAPSMVPVAPAAPVRAAPMSAPASEAVVVAPPPANAPAHPESPVAARRFWTGRGGPAPRPTRAVPTAMPLDRPAPAAAMQPATRAARQDWTGFEPFDHQIDDERVIDLLAARSGRIAAE